MSYSLKDLTRDIDVCEKKRIIERFIQESSDKEKVKDYMNNFLTFSKQGASGAKIGYLKNNPSSIIKMNKFKREKFIKYRRGCLYVENYINEILINIVLTNFRKFGRFTDKQSILLDTHILKMIDFALDKKKVLIITPKVGIDHMSKYYTNLDNVVLYNLKKLRKNFPIHLEEFERFLLKEVVEPLNETVKILYNKFGYINTDMKIKNVFLRGSKKRGYKKLRESGLIIDYTPLVADLDKARIKLGGNDILVEDSFMAKKVLTLTRYQPLIDLRTNCQNSYGVKKCKKIKEGDYDMLTLMINIYLNFYKFDLKTTNILDEFIRKRFKLDLEEINYFKKLIYSEVKNKLNPIPLTRVTNISKIIYYFCRELK